MSEQNIDKWARRYAERIRSDESLRYAFEVFTQEDMSLRKVEKHLMSRRDFRHLYAELACPLDGAEFRFMLAAIPHWLDVLENPRPERRPDPEPAPEWLREAVAKQVKVIKAITEEVKKLRGK